MDIDKLISDKDFWTTTKVCVKVLLPSVKVLRFSDGIRGGNLLRLENRSGARPGVRVPCLEIPWNPGTNLTLGPNDSNLF